MTTLPATAHRVPVDEDVSLHVQERGSGPAVLLITGLGYGLWSFEPVVDRLAGRWRTIALDNRGTGRSSKPGSGYAISRLAEDASAVLRRLEAASAHVVGFSMGGYVAVTLAVAEPDLVRSLVLVASSVGGPGHTPVPAETVAAWQRGAHLDPPAYARATMPLSFSPGWCDAHPDAYERILTRRLEYPTPMAVWRAQFDACEAFLRDGVAAGGVRAPVLAVHGDRDRVVPVANAEHTRRAIPHAEVVVLPGRGHLAHLEDPDGFVEVVHPFLAGQEAR